MSIFSYTAADLFKWLTEKEDIIVVDVRNEKEFERFKVESPYPFSMLNIPYYDFMEVEEESVGKLPQGATIRIVCAKENSAKYVAEIVANNGFKDVGYLAGGIKNWGNLLVPKQVHQAENYKVYQFIRPGKASCSYGLISDDEMMLFDPSRNIDFYMGFAKEKGCRIIKSFETHLQADYIAGSRDICAQSGAQFLANDADFSGSKNDYISLVDGEMHTFSKSGPKVRVLFTPGHTPGSTCFIIDEKYFISGDMVFIDSIGRPDLGGKAVEWAQMLFGSLNTVKMLDRNLMVLPGHYISWTEANEELIFTSSLDEVIKRNQSIYDIDTLELFVDFIKENMRPQPEEYAQIRLVNGNLEQFDNDKQEELDLGKNECAASAYQAQQASATSQ